MKYLSIIIALTLLVTSFVPCSDAIIADSFIEHEHHEHGGDTHEEGCSPFCTCDCCSISFDQTEIRFTIISSSRSNVSIFNKKQLGVYAFDYSFDFKIGIWNPPKVA